MIYRRPNYYDKFQCTAGDCEATCCAGWQIVIDEAALERYEQEQGTFAQALHEGIDWEEGVFKQDIHKRCAFLNENNLCDMFGHLGEESLCMTCTNYPRHIEEFENIREVTLAISCPQAAHIILGQKEPVTFYEEDTGEEDEVFEDFDPFFFSYLEDAREIAVDILQNRAWSISVRTALLRTFAQSMQYTIEHSELYELADLFEQYENENFLTKKRLELEKEITAFHENAGESFSYSKAVFGRLYELEHLTETWEPYIEECWHVLYGRKAEGYASIQEGFRTWYQSTEIRADLDLEMMLEQLLVYFVSTYFCGAVYDDNLIGKVEMSITSVYILYEMFAAAWVKQKQTLSHKDIERICYRYSRELEHSDINLEILEQV